MAQQLVMNQTGHSTHEFDPADSMQLKQAMERFAELVGNGMAAAKLMPDGKHELIRAFDPTVEQTLFIPHLKGG